MTARSFTHSKRITPFIGIVVLAGVFLFTTAASAQPYSASPSAGQFYRQEQAYGGTPSYMVNQGAQQGSQRSGDWQGQAGRQFQGSSQQQQGQQGQQHAWQMEGMVRIGYDLDNDGNLDAFQYIPYYELQRIRQQNQGGPQQQAQMGQRYQGRQDQAFQRYHDQARMQQQAQAGQWGMQQDRAARGYFEQRRQQQVREFDSLQGRIQQMRSVNLAEMDEPHVIARVETQEGQLARVDLGPERKISELNLQKGDRVQILGTQGTINNKAYLMAHTVQAGQQQVRINRPQDRNIGNYSGRILKTKPAGFGDQGDNNLMARVRLQDGSTTIVNLGPEKELKNNLNVQEGKEINMLARPAFIEGKRALVAEAVTIDGQAYDVTWEKPSPPAAGSGQSQPPSAGSGQSQQ